MKYKVGQNVIYQDGNKSKPRLAKIVSVCEDRQYDDKKDDKIYYITYSYVIEDWYSRDSLHVGNKLYNWFHKRLNRKLKIGDKVHVREWEATIPPTGIIKATRIDDPKSYYVQYLYPTDDWVHEDDLEHDVVSFLKELDKENDAKT